MFNITFLFRLLKVHPFSRVEKVLKDLSVGRKYLCTFDKHEDMSTLAQKIHLLLFMCVEQANTHIKKCNFTFTHLKHFPSTHTATQTCLLWMFVQLYNIIQINIKRLKLSFTDKLKKKYAKYSIRDLYNINVSHNFS